MPREAKVLSKKVTAIGECVLYLLYFNRGSVKIQDQVYGWFLGELEILCQVVDRRCTMPPMSAFWTRFPELYFVAKVRQMWWNSRNQRVYAPPERESGDKQQC